MTRRPLPTIFGPALLLLAACGEASPPAPAPAAKPVESSPPAPVNIEPGQGLPPISSAAPRYVGRWAATEALCRDGAWRFRSDGLSTAGEVSCAFDKVTEKPGGYDIDATCIAQAPPKQSRIGLTFAESAKAMMVDGGPFSGPVALIYCGAE